MTRDAGALARALASLMCSEHRIHALFRDAHPAREKLEELATECCDQASSGTQEMFEVAGTLEGAVLVWPSQFPYFGVSGQAVKIFLRPGHAEARAWAAGAVRRLRLVPSEVTLCTLSIAHLELLPVLVQQGLGVDSVELVGHTPTALSRLVEDGTPTDFTHVGLRHVRLGPSRVDEAIALRADVFRDPEQRRYCWFACNPAHLVAHRERFTDEIASDRHLWYALLDGDHMVGVFGSSLVPDNPLWGPRGGLELYFGPGCRGRGLARTAYRIILQGLADGGFDVFKGATAQPGVMALGSRMGRTVQTLNLRSNADFEPEHFAACIAAGSPPGL